MTSSCSLCHRMCMSDRSRSFGFCGCSSLPKVARIGLHHYEEPPISGNRGSGAIFFAGCNLRCIFCQNLQLQDASFGENFDAKKLANAMLELEAMGAHNINLVTPTPHIITIVEAINEAKMKDLSIPIVYNTNSYIALDAINLLNGLVDIYLPDLKYKSDVLSTKFSNAPRYFDNAIAAIERMYEQVGNLSVKSDGIATKGVLLRHLVLPTCAFDTRDILDEICARFGKDAYLSLMRQYTPRPDLPSPLNRRITDREYRSCSDYCRQLGLNNVFLQAKDSATFAYTPKFSDKINIIE